MMLFFKMVHERNFRNDRSLSEENSIAFPKVNTKASPCFLEPSYSCNDKINTCQFDETCAQGGLGCNAGGHELCRFCGGTQYGACKDYKSQSVYYDNRNVANIKFYNADTVLPAAQFTANQAFNTLLSAGLHCYLPPQIILGTGTWEGELFASQLYHIGQQNNNPILMNFSKGIQAFAHGFTWLTMRNLMSPCDYVINTSYTLPDFSPLDFTEHLVVNALKKNESAFVIDENYASNLIIQGALVASGGLSNRIPSPDCNFASKYIDLLRRVEKANITPQSYLNEVEFEIYIEATLFGFRNIIACKCGMLLCENCCLGGKEIF